MMEAVVRLLPGFMGNTESLAEESHGTDGLLEYPVFTKPARWRGLTVPDVLLSGDHARIHDWRRRQARDRTEQRRPDLRRGSPNPEPSGRSEERRVGKDRRAERGMNQKEATEDLMNREE